MEIGRWWGDAEFVGGNEKLLGYIATHLNFSMERWDITNTRLVVTMEIDTAGKVQNPEIVRSVHKELDRQVIEILLGMPPWKPAYRYGKPIRQRYQLPLDLDFG